MDEKLTDEELHKALNGTFLGGMFDYINRWKGNVESIEVRPSPELREIADIFCAIGEARGRVMGMGEAVKIVEDWQYGMFTSDDAKAFLVGQIRQAAAQPKKERP
ncbi:MAG: hypothetical protein A2Y38_25265 [Spirochaetes bacterium GWB1_59_5]|nr:MAG: hypothetical protein A2Y38_25265 [Spirochaetes bacterium GWB1_59_5]